MPPAVKQTRGAGGQFTGQASGQSSGQSDGQTAADINLNLEDFLDGLGTSSGCVVHVWRSPKGDDLRDGHLFKAALPAADPYGWLMDKLQNTYGGGNFLVRLKEGGRWLPGSKVESVEPPANWQPPGAGPAASPAVASGAVTMDALQRLLLEQQNGTLKMLLERQQPAANSSSWDAAKITAIGTLAAPVITGIFSLLSGKTSTAKELLETVAVLKEVSGNGEGGGEGNGATGMDVVKAGLNMLPGFLQAFAAQAANQSQPQDRPALPRPPQPKIPPPSASPGPASNDQPPSDQEQPTVSVREPTQEEIAAAYLQELSRLITMLAKAAANESDPGSYAVVVVDTVEEYGEEFLQPLLSLTPDQMIEMVGKVYPQVAQNCSAWFRELHAQMHDYADSESDETPPET